MEKVKIVIVVLALSIFGVIISSAGYAIPFVQATSSDGNNNAQTFSDDVPPSGDGNNNAQTFEGELLPQLSPSNEKVIQFEDTPTKTIAQSDNLQNPSIQADLNQSVLSSQKDVPDLQQSNPKQSKEKHDYIFELPNGEGCYWQTSIVSDAKWVSCTTKEADAAYKKQEAAKRPIEVEDDRARHSLQEFGNVLPPTQK